MKILRTRHKIGTRKIILSVSVRIAKHLSVKINLRVGNGPRTLVCDAH
jgi:hypothetical protein